LKQKSFILIDLPHLQVCLQRWWRAHCWHPWNICSIGEERSSIECV